MDPDRNGSSRSRAGPAKGESSATSVRLDNILGRESTRPGGPSGGLLPSRLDQPHQQPTRPGGPSGSFLPSRLDQLYQGRGIGSSSGPDSSRRFPALSRPGQPSLHQNPSLRYPMPSNLDNRDPGSSTLRNPLWNPVGNSRPLRPTESSSRPTRAQAGSEVRPATKTAFTSPHDIIMASRQTQYESLSPQEQKKQEEWAQEKVQTLGPCPAGFRWLRVTGGYNCEPGTHWTSDELVAEGRGGYYTLRQSTGSQREDRAIGFSNGLSNFKDAIYPGDDPLRDALYKQLAAGMFNPY
jgi:hypothetical protein